MLTGRSQHQQPGTKPRDDPNPELTGTTPAEMDWPRYALKLKRLRGSSVAKPEPLSILKAQAHDLLVLSSQRFASVAASEKSLASQSLMRMSVDDVGGLDRKPLRCGGTWMRCNICKPMTVKVRPPTKVRNV